MCHQLGETLTLTFCIAYIKFSHVFHAALPATPPFKGKHMKITLLLVTVDDTKTHIHALKKQLTAIAENRSDHVHVRQKAAQLQLVEAEGSAAVSCGLSG